MTEIPQVLETKLPGFVTCLGGQELQQASRSLFGKPSRLHSVESSDRPSGHQKAVQPVALKHMNVESEDDPQVKELILSIQRFSYLAHRYPPSFDDKYHYGLLLQEMAAKLRYDLETNIRILPVDHIYELLGLACDKYREALELRPSFHAALYNWGVALSELSSLWKSRDQTKARQYLHLASQKYSESIKKCNNNPRGLNNWGLVLQEVSNYETDPSKRIELAVQSIDKFRMAVRCQLNFDHGCYNLGTIYYTHASHIVESQKNQSVAQYTYDNGKPVKSLEELIGEGRSLEEIGNIMMRYAAQYICLASALRPQNSVYQGSVAIVKHCLPRPFLKVGHLKVVRKRSLNEVKEIWERQWFALDAKRFASGIGRQYLRGGNYVQPKNREREEPGPDEYDILVRDLVAVDQCSELSLPEGSAFWVQTQQYPQGFYLLSEDKENAAQWVDCLKFCHHIHKLNRSQNLSEILGPHPFPALDCEKKIIPDVQS